MKVSKDTHPTSEKDWEQKSANYFEFSAKKRLTENENNFQVCSYYFPNYVQPSKHLKGRCAGAVPFIIVGNTFFPDLIRAQLSLEKTLPKAADFLVA